MPRKTSVGKMPSASTPWSFNEAAARCRGKPTAAARETPAPARFNEAAARCRGKPAPTASA